MCWMPSRSRMDAVHDQAAGLGGLHDVVEEVVAHDRPAVLLAEQVHHQHVPGLQHVDRGLVEHARLSGRLRAVVDHALEVRPQGHELHGERAPGQLQARMQDAEVARVLVAEAFLREDGEHLLRGKTAGALDQRVGNPGAAVGEALERVLGRELDHLVLRDREDLGLGEGGRQHGSGERERPRTVGSFIVASFPVDDLGGGDSFSFRNENLSRLTRTKPVGSATVQRRSVIGWRARIQPHDERTHRRQADPPAPDGGHRGRGPDRVLAGLSRRLLPLPSRSAWKSSRRITARRCRARRSASSSRPAPSPPTDVTPSTSSARPGSTSSACSPTNAPCARARRCGIAWPRTWTGRRSSGGRRSESAGRRVDADTRLPIVDLGSAKLTAEDMRDLDAIVFDLQDPGVRFFTVMGRLQQCMETAADAGIEFVVLDRPNPLGGDLVEGPTREAGPIGARRAHEPGPRPARPRPDHRRDGAAHPVAPRQAAPPHRRAHEGLEARHDLDGIRAARGRRSLRTSAARRRRSSIRAWDCSRRRTSRRDAGRISRSSCSARPGSSRASCHPFLRPASQSSRRTSRREPPPSR